MKQIVDSSFINNGKIINLHSKGIQDAGFEYLLKKETKKVVSLNLHDNKLSPLSMLRMRETRWDSLTNLWLRQNIIGDKGCKYLSTVCLPQINKISLPKNQISSLGVFHLAKAEWKNLQYIYFGGNRIGLDGVKRLTSAKWNKKLNTIYLDDNQLFVGQIYQSILCEKGEFLTFQVWNNKVEQCYKGNLKSTLELKSISLFIW